MLLVPSTAINKTSALRLILSFALSKQGDDEFWSKILLPMIALSLTRELKLFEGKIEKVLTKDDALSLAHALGQRRVTDA